MVTTPSAFETLTELATSQKRPPVHLWNPEREGIIDIHIDRDGMWFHEGDPIRRQPLVDLFATILRRDDDDYFLVTPHEKLRIEVEDVPFIAVDFEASAVQDTIVFVTNVGDAVALDAQHPLHMRGDTPYLEVRDGLQARIERSVFYRLVELGFEAAGEWRLKSRGSTFSLGTTC